MEYILGRSLALVAISCQASFEIIEFIFEVEPHIYVINVIIIKGLWVRLCKWQLSLSNMIESFILNSLSVEDFNFSCNKIVQPKKGECSLALLLQLVFNSLLMLLRIVIKLLLSWVSTFFPFVITFLAN